MSRIYFHSPSEDSEVAGPERAHAGMLVSDLLCSALGVNRHTTDHDPIWDFLPPDCYLRIEPIQDKLRALDTWLHLGWEDFHVPGQEPLEIFAMALNTAIVSGSDPLILLARLHGQCEIHAYVEGQNRPWLAGIISRGIESGIMRPNMGWELTAQMLSCREDEPVVTSFSVCEQFPSRPVGLSEEDADAWYDLPDSEQWEEAMSRLRQDSWLEMKPDNWRSYAFGHKINGYQFREIMTTHRAGKELARAY